MKPSKHSLDNHANQLNPQCPAFHLSRGASLKQAEQAAKIARNGVKPLQLPKKSG